MRRSVDWTYVGYTIVADFSGPIMTRCGVVDLTGGIAMSILWKILAVVGALTVLIGGGGFILSFLGIIGAVGIGLIVVALPIIGILFVIIFLVWLVWKFAVTLFKDNKKEKES